MWNRWKTFVREVRAEVKKVTWPKRNGSPGYDDRWCWSPVHRLRGLSVVRRYRHGACVDLVVRGGRLVRPHLSRTRLTLTEQAERNEPGGCCPSSGSRTRRAGGAGLRGGCGRRPPLMRPSKSTAVDAATESERVCRRPEDGRRHELVCRTHLFGLRTKGDSRASTSAFVLSGSSPRKFGDVPDSYRGRGRDEIAARRSSLSKKFFPGLPAREHVEMSGGALASREEHAARDRVRRGGASTRFALSQLPRSTSILNQDGGVGRDAQAEVPASASRARPCALSTGRSPTSRARLTRSTTAAAPSR